MLPDDQLIGKNSDTEIEPESLTGSARYDVVALGETMVRYSTPLGNRLQNARQMDVGLGGAESNVLAALARMDRRVAWISSLPRNALGMLVADILRTTGIDLSLVDWREGGRVGAFFVEYGQGPLTTSVIYDRANSCIAQLDSAAINWQRALNTRIFHLTGITPALSATARALTQDAANRARAAGIPFSFDVNYRSKLWSESAASEALPRIAFGAEILCCAERDAQLLWGIQGDTRSVCIELQRIFGARYVGVSVGAEGAYLWSEGELHHEDAVPVHVVDRIGAGDGLAAGLLHGWLGGNVVRGLRYGVALAALAASQFGDMITTTAAEVEEIANAQADVSKHSVRR